MRKKIQDERIINESRKQNNIGFTVLYIGLLLILLYRQFILKQTVHDIWDIALLFFGVTFYLALKRIFSGLFSYSKDSKINIKSIIPTALIASIVFVIVNIFVIDYSTKTELIISGIAFFVCFTGVFILMQYISNKKNDDMLDED